MLANRNSKRPDFIKLGKNVFSKGGLLETFRIKEF